MKIQGLAVIAIIIILPMTIILTAYSKSQIQTLQLQINYDSKLSESTYDAIKAFQLNMSNSSTSDLSDSKMRDIKASINTFYNSLSSNFNMAGYGKDVLQNYVPAVVYTLYDGYYIYSAYDNTLDPEDEFDANATYKDGETLYGLKPYIYYSCRYKNSSCDVVITYSLDSYITIQGTINGNSVNESGYLLSGVTKSPDNDTYYYNGIEIKSESSLTQNAYVNDKNEVRPYQYKKVNGVKYYQDNEQNAVFSIINDAKYIQSDITDVTTNNNALKYYKDAYEFKQKIISGDLSAIKDLRVSNAVDSNGNSYTNTSIYTNQDVDNPYASTTNVKIFDELTSGTIEDTNSNFNAHRLQVIKNAIETNLVPAIANYNTISTSDVNFQMPKLNDEEWEQICQNVSMITFLQGLSIGGKVYNGHAIVSNNNNEDFVSEDSIYIVSDNQYHRVTENGLSNNINGAVGVLNIDFQRRAAQRIIGHDDVTDTDLTQTIYYYPREEMASYTSIVNYNGGASTYKSTGEYVKNELANSTDNNKKKLAELYYTALGRERYGMYRVQNKLEEVHDYLKGNI